MQGDSSVVRPIANRFLAYDFVLGAALADCLQTSDCIMVQRNKAADCLRPPLVDELPLKCQQLKKGLGDCRRGMLDMRKRFRGNWPVAAKGGIEVGSDQPSHQLYAGKPTFTEIKASEEKVEGKNDS